MRGNRLLDLRAVLGLSGVSIQNRCQLRRGPARAAVGISSGSRYQTELDIEGMVTLETGSPGPPTKSRPDRRSRRHPRLPLAADGNAMLAHMTGGQRIAWDESNVSGIANITNAHLQEWPFDHVVADCRDDQ